MTGSIRAGPTNHLRKTCRVNPVIGVIFIGNGADISVPPHGGGGGTRRPSPATARGPAVGAWARMLYLLGRPLGPDLLNLA
jgi:hypothetical protein